MARSHNVGFRVFNNIPRPSRDVIEELGKFETTLLSDAMNRLEHGFEHSPSRPDHARRRTGADGARADGRQPDGVRGIRGGAAGRSPGDRGARLHDSGSAGDMLAAATRKVSSLVGA